MKYKREIKSKIPTPYTVQLFSSAQSSAHVWCRKVSLGEEASTKTNFGINRHGSYEDELRSEYRSLSLYAYFYYQVLKEQHQ